MLYPLKFSPILKQTIWGGERLRTKKGGEELTKIGESWEISGIQDNISVVSEGALADNTLEELIEVYMGDIVGDKIYEKFGIEFPLMVKYIDAQDNLSVQVHPDNQTAKERHKAYGKNEMWYVLDADKDAELILGFKHPIDKSEYLTRLQNHSLPEILKYEKVKPGDSFYIPTGTVHSIGKGCFIVEITQTSDITYRIYDYDRVDTAGNPRELHTELSTDVIQFTVHEKHQNENHRHENHIEELVQNDYFTVDYLKFNKEIEKDYFHLDSFVIYVCLTGNFTIVYNTDQSVKVNCGETVLLPACFKSVFLIPDKESSILEIYCEQ